MESKKAKPLTGKDNRRLKLKDSVDQNKNAAWADIKELQPETNVAIPSLQNVENAKDWVDNGSKL